MIEFEEENYLFQLCLKVHRQKLGTLEQEIHGVFLANVVILEGQEVCLHLFLVFAKHKWILDNERLNSVHGESHFVRD